MSRKRKSGFFGRGVGGSLSGRVGTPVGGVIGSSVGGSILSSIASAVLPVLVATVAVSTVWSVHTQSISVVKNALDKEDDRWSIIFSELYTVDRGNLVTGSNRTAIETLAPTLSNSTISGFEIEMGTPGDFISYRFRIKNTGNVPAKVATFSAVDSSYITCEPMDGSTITAAKATALCNHLELTMKYVEDGYAVETNDYYEVDQEREVELKLVYNPDINRDDIPDDDVRISVKEISIPFVQA